jgi:hypothetical protein
MELLEVVVAQSVVRDADTNYISLFNILDEMNSPTFPTVVPSLGMLTIFERIGDEEDPAAVQVRMRINDQVLHVTPLAVAFQGRARTRAILTVHGLVLTAPGNLVFEVLMNNQAIGSWKVLVLNTGEVQTEAVGAVA